HGTNGLDDGAPRRRCDRLGPDSVVGAAGGGRTPSDRRGRERCRPPAGADVGAAARVRRSDGARRVSRCDCARSALPLLLAILPPDLPRVEQAVIGARALVYTVGVGTFVTAVCALLPLLT